MMTSQSSIAALKERELADYGYARTRDIAFDAVQALWRRRVAEGLKQKEVAKTIARDPGWVSKNLRGPGNWTLRTFGELIEGLGGELEIRVCAQEDPICPPSNYNAYLGYSPSPKPKTAAFSTSATVELPKTRSAAYKVTLK